MKGAYFWINRSPNTHPAFKLQAYQPMTAANLPEPIGWLSKIKQFIFKSAESNSTTSTDPLKIQQYSDARGRTLWYVYDPIDKRIACLGSMAEVQAWMSQQDDRSNRSFAEFEEGQTQN